MTHRFEYKPVLEITDIEKGFDDIAKTHFPSEYDASYKWREIGITLDMVKEFCRMRKDIQLIVFHKGRKIEELLVDDQTKGAISTLVLHPFSDHVMFQKNNKHGASQSNLRKMNYNEDDSEDDSEYNMSISIPVISKAKPPLYSEWLELDCFLDLFNKILEGQGVKRDIGGQKKYNIEKSKTYVRGDGDMTELKAYFVNKEKKYHKFEVKTVYGDTLDIIMSIIITLQGHPQYHIKKVPVEAYNLNEITYEIQKDYKKFKYSGETLAQFGDNLRAVLMSDRQEPPQNIKNELFKSQNGKCAHCQGILDDTCELDHIIRVADGGTNDINSLQYLCKPCHDDKCESEEPLNELPNKIRWESSQSGDVCEGYMGCDKPQNLIFGDGIECDYAIDEVRSRLNGIIEPPWDFPKIHILDVIEPYHERGEISGTQIFIDAGLGNTNDMFDFICYQKPLWYPYECAMFLLQHQVHSEKGVITRDDFKLMLIPSRVISRSERVEVFDKMKK